MSEGPAKRRWFQFRLASWFVLVAILAWAMSLKPEFRYKHSTGLSGGPPDIFIFEFFYVSPDRSINHWEFWAIGISALLWPALALVAFVAWKAVRLFLNHRHEKPPPHA